MAPTGCVVRRQPREVQVRTDNHSAQSPTGDDCARARPVQDMRAAVREGEAMSEHLIQFWAGRKWHEPTPVCSNLAGSYCGCWGAADCDWSRKHAALTIVKRRLRRDVPEEDRCKTCQRLHAEGKP